MTKVFFAKEGTIKIDAAADITLSSSTVIDTAFASATTIAQFKDFSITLPNADVDKIDLLGVTSSFQNAELEEKPAPLAEMSGTIIVPGDELMEGEIWGSGTAAGGTHTTYQPGLSTKIKLALMLNVDDGTDEINWAGTDMQCTQYDPSFTGADGHVEASVTFKCLPKNLFGPQFKD